MKTLLRDSITTWQNLAQTLMRQIVGAILFYTSIPLPSPLVPDLTRIARWSPSVGLLMGGLLWILDLLMEWGQLSITLRSVIVVCLWMALTGGLHLDGAMDTADGLGVFDPKRRLAVMADSRTGAFGVLAAIAIILLKITALAAIQQTRGIALLWAMGWGRWAHLLAIGLYPYLKPEGKGAFHRLHFQPRWDYWPGLLCNGLGLYLWVVMQGQPELIWSLLWVPGVCWGVGHWFFRRFRGMTGDLYGAVIEWSETFILLGFSLLEAMLL
ncbi:adenosylcobinamide-GDP ribazoletransferase [Lyngbya confervoides]|uniref:Adenosylcobinamide-GDP ribazoletransferase n=1 Tax=Lyngbya confervoides BDU141951 TaxID=1574623 RepID=A0ABD4T7P3_9CYAN|nr:adenosylcobinamide-GDP ribazoletransferase [Lyngbya confervoides]MCM1984738.1 adenosylcobinamide-GDP ribazoletransferase [Lyngbya confervoides BDU141951]